MDSAAYLIMIVRERKAFAQASFSEDVLGKAKQHYDFDKNFPRVGKADSWVSARLEHFISYKPYVSHEKCYTEVTSKNRASHYKYIRLNNQSQEAWIVVDIDNPSDVGKKEELFSHYYFEDKGLPVPNIVLQNPETNHYQAIYAIEPVTISENGRDKPKAYLRWVKEALNAIIPHADPEFTGAKSWNPLNSHWKKEALHNCVYSLGELMDFIPEDIATSSKPSIFAAAYLNLEVAEEGERNSTLFNHVRNYAYSKVRFAKENMSYMAWREHLLAKTIEFNKAVCSPMLPVLEENSICKSVASWTWNKYKGNRKVFRGAMKLDDSIDLQERQKASSKRTHRLRREETTSLVINAVNTLLDQNQKVTQKAIAELSGRSVVTISKYKQAIENAKNSWTPKLESKESCKEIELVTKESENNKPKNINYGVHQVAIGLPSGKHELVSESLNVIPFSRYLDSS